MEILKLTRRRFAGLAAAAAATQAMDVRGQASKNGSNITAGDIIKRISTNSGVALPDKSVDGFKAGGDGSTVHGIAVTSMATMEVLRQAAKAKLNLVVSFEPTFYGRTDAQPNVAMQGPGARSIVAQDDPILVAKRNFIRSNGMVVYRLHDQWASRKENEHAKALATAMGWSRAADGAGSAATYEIAPISLAELVPQVRAKLKVSGGVRVVGDPKLQVRRVTVMPGTQALPQLLATLPFTDLILAGEVRDWEGPEYVGDASSAGLNKGSITVGKVASEDPGMRACATWIETFIHEVPVEWIAAGEPYWRPA
jgi:hypothetical protein